MKECIMALIIFVLGVMNGVYGMADGIYKVQNTECKSIKGEDNAG